MIRDVGWTAIIKATYIVAQMAVNIVLARLLGVEDFGFYALVMAFVQILIVPAQLGFPSSLMRHMSQLAGRGEGLAARRLLRVAALSVAGAGLLAGLGWTLSGYLLAPRDLLPVWFLILGLALADVGGAALRGLGSVVESQVAQQLLRPGVYLALLGGTVWLSAGLIPQKALALHAVAAVLATVYALVSSGVKIARLPADGLPQAPRAIVAASLPFLLLASIQVVNYQIALVMVGLLLDTADVGVYRTAVQIADGLGVVLFGFSMALGPRIVRLQTQGQIAALRRMLLRTHLAALAIMLVLGGIVALFAGPILGLVFGPEYAAGAPPLAILAVGKIFYAGVAFSGLGLSMLGQPGRSTLALSVGLALNVVLTWVLIPAFGLSGASLAAVLAAFGGNLLAAFFLAATLRQLADRSGETP